VTAPPSPRIDYAVSLEDGRSHLVSVAMRVRGVEASALDLAMPLWTPGSYLVREFAQHVQEVRAASADGKALALRKTAKNAWRVETGGASEVTVSYRVWAFEPTVRTSYLDAEHATLNGASIFLHVPGRTGEPATLRLRVPPGWNAVSTALEREEGETGFVYRASDYEELVDSPIEAGRHAVHAFEAAGVPHELAIVGRGDVDPRRLSADLGRVVEAAADLMGGRVPYRRYVFLVHLVGPGVGGGLEHRASSLLQMPRNGFRPDGEYARRLALAAHEHFHVWNVKRFRPRDLVPIDYGREMTTSLLWVAEGFTSYYEWVVLRRAGLVTGHQFLEALARDARHVLETPGRFVQSLAEASFDAWIKFYRQNENSRNSQVSYYVKGAVVALLLDLFIREKSRGARSLDDVVRALDAAADRPGYRGYGADDVKAAAERAAGGASLDAFFRDAIEGTKEIDLARALAPFGLEPAWVKEPVPSGAPERRGFLGMSLSIDGGRLRAKTVLSGSPAMQAGISPGDEIVAAGGFRVAELSSFRARVEESEPGTELEIVAFHRDALYAATATVGEAPRGDYVFRRVPRPTPEQRTLYEQWIGEPFDREPTHDDLLAPVGKPREERFV